MPRQSVIVTESMLASRRKLTAAQWLTESALRGGKTRADKLASPVTIKTAASDESKVQTVTVRRSGHFFGEIVWAAKNHALVTAISSRGWRLGPHGLHLLNIALNAFAVRKNGLTVVEHFVRIQCNRFPLRGDILRLFSFLEIRPVYSSKRDAQKPVPSENAKHYV